MLPNKLSDTVMKAKWLSISFFALFMAIDLSAGIAAVELEPLDTTRVRAVIPVKKSIGEKITDIPGEILKLPIYVVQYVGRTVSTSPVVSKVFSLLRFGGEKKTLTAVGGYGSRPGLKVGFALQNTDVIAVGDRFQYKWFYSTHNYQFYQLKYETDYSLSHRLEYRLVAGYDKRPRQRFYGVGLESSADKEANISLERSDIDASTSFRLTPNTIISFTGGFQSVNLFDGRAPNLEGNLVTIFTDPSYGLKPGQLGGSRYVKFGAAFERDSRNSQGQPSRGTHLLVHSDRFIGVGRSNGQDFTRYGVDFRSFHDLWRKRIVAFRLQLQRIDSDEVAGGIVPVYLMSSLGGIDALRGFNRGRFVDNDMAMVSVEYRYPIYNFLDAFLFVDGGRVYADLIKEAVFKNWKQSVGAGIRIWKSSDVNAIVQIGHSDEATRLYFEIGATW